MVKNARSTKIPAFMIPPGLGPDILEAGREVVQNEWSEFVEILDSGGPGAGYQRLLALRERLEVRKKEISSELEKWEDREDWLGKLKGHYHLKLQDLAGIEKPSAIWRTQGVTDPVEQLPDAATSLADQPIVQTFLDFDDDGRLKGEPELGGGWTAYVENISIGWFLDGTAGEFVTDGPEPHRENMTVRYRLSDGELERSGIDPENLESPRSAIEMKPSTTWREALLQIEEKEQSVREEKGRPKRTIRVLDFRLRILENVLYRFEAFGSVEDMTEDEAEEVAKVDYKESPIGGYYGAEYATDARDVLRRNPSINSFSVLKREMGESKVDTVKRNIGYDNLPREVKEKEGFSRFKSMLKEKVEQLEGEEE